MWGLAEAVDLQALVAAAGLQASVAVADLQESVVPAHHHASGLDEADAAAPKYRSELAVLFCEI